MQVLLLLGGLVVCGYVLARITIWRPMWGLTLGAMLIYNPAFNYRFLFTHEFEGGSIRALLSLGVLACVYCGVFVNRKRNKTLSPGRVEIPWQASYLVVALIGAVVGLLAGHDLRLVGSDLFPVIEFAAYFPLVRLACRNRDEAARFAVILLAWGGVVSAADVILYIFRGNLFVSRFALNGGTTLVHRLDDFIPALLLPVTVVTAILGRDRTLKFLATGASASLAAATILSFFRSLWLGLLVASAVILVIGFAGQMKRIRVTKRAAIFAAMGGGLAAVVVAVMAIVKVAGTSILYLAVSRAAHLENTSGTARVDDNLQLLSMFRMHPLGIGLGAVSRSGPVFSASDYYLTVAVELGLVGLVVLVAMGVAFIDLNYWRYRVSSDRFVRALILGTIGSYVTMAVTLLTFPSLLHFPIPAYLALLGGIVGVLTSAHAGADRPTEVSVEINWSQFPGAILRLRATEKSSR
jgi:hypothetical protein